MQFFHADGAVGSEGPLRQSAEDGYGQVRVAVDAVAKLPVENASVLDTITAIVSGADSSTPAPAGGPARDNPAGIRATATTRAFRTSVTEPLQTVRPAASRGTPLLYPVGDGRPSSVVPDCGGAVGARAGVFGHRAGTPVGPKEDAPDARPKRVESASVEESVG